MINIEKLPSADNSERGVIGSILLDPGVVNIVAGIIDGKDFHSPTKGRLFDFLVRWHHSGKAVDTMAIVDHMVQLPDEGKSLGGVQTVISLSDRAVTALRAETQAREIAEASARRRAVFAAVKLAESAMDPTVELEAMLATQADALTTMQPENQRPWATGGEVALEYDDDLVAVRERGLAPGVETGVMALDKVLGGSIGLDWLMYLGARPGQGKTALALNILRRLSDRRFPSVFISLEMSRRGIRNRLLSEMSGVSLTSVRKMDYRPGEEERVEQAVNDLSTFPFIIDDTPMMTVEQIISRVKRIAAIHGAPKMVFVDYLQLIEPSTKGSTREQITHISRRLKLGTKMTGCPWLVMSQLTREAEGVRPQMKHLRESGGIEADADVILFPFRPNKDAGRRQGFPGAGGPVRDDTMEIIVGKHRHHEADTIATVKWNGACQRITDR